MMNRICSLIIMTVFVSFLGFVLENAWLAVTKGYIDNRNMTLPFLLGYGLLIVGYYEIAGTPDTLEMTCLPQIFRNKNMQTAVYFLLTFLTVSIGEIILGTFTEKYFGFCYWNYERLPLHITRYTSVPTSCGFALIITVFMKYVFVPAVTAVQSISIYILLPVSAVSAILLTADFLKSFYAMHKTKRLNQRWRIDISSFIGKYTDEIPEKYYLTRRF